MLRCALLLPFLVLGGGAAAPAPKRTVMAFVSVAAKEWQQCADYLLPGGEGQGTVNAISIDNLYHFDPAATPMITPDPAAIAEHARVWMPHFRTYPMIGLGGTANMTDLRPLLYNASKRGWWVDFLVREAVARGYDGLNVDFEPKTNVVDPDDNASPRDALAFADLLETLGAALHAAAPGKTLSVDTMAVTGACWTSGEGKHYPKIDAKPCPWIRRFWDLSALSAVKNLDRIISMDTYTANSTEYPADITQYHHFFPIERFGLGLCPWGCGHPAPTSPCVEGRIAAAVAYGASEIDLWSLWDSRAANWSVVERAWRPWVGPLRNFLAGKDPPRPDALCWDETDAGLRA